MSRKELLVPGTADLDHRKNCIADRGGDLSSTELGRVCFPSGISETKISPKVPGLGRGHSVRSPLPLRSGSMHRV